MPTYEYRCDPCDRNWDEIRRIVEDVARSKCDCGQICPQVIHGGSAVNGLATWEEWEEMT